MKRLEGGYLGGRPTWSLGSNPGVWAMEQVFARRVAGTWPVGSGSFDEFYEYVVLLLHMNGSNASTAFPDSSLRNLAVTAVSSSITTSQSKFNGASGNFVRSSGGRLNIATTNSEFVFGAGDFTIEAWVYLNSLPGTGYPGSYWITGWGAQNSDTGCKFYLTTTNIVFSLASYVAPQISAAHNMSTGQWYHVAVTRNGSSLRAFVNGQEKGAGTSTVDAVTPSFGSAIAISAAEVTGGSTGGNFDGFIDELRITKGYCRYTSTFSVPTAAFENDGASIADPFYNYVSLLLPLNGSNNSTTFTDRSPGARTVTPSGDAKLSTADKRYGVSSAYFDGTGDFLTIADTNSGFTFGTGDFTYEWWFKSNAANNYAAMLTRPYSGAGGILISLNGATGDGAPEVYWREWTNGLFFKSSITGLNDNKWHHFAFVRSGTTVFMFIDGVQAASKTSVSTSVGSSSVVIGQDVEFAGRTYTGYIDDVRITKGVARYIANFIPPLPHADYGTLVDSYSNATTLLMPMEGPNNSTGFFDRADRVIATTYGNAKLTNAQARWGSTSALFDGTGDYVQLSSQPTIGTGDFTIEFWAYPNSISGIQGYVDFRPGQGAYPCIYQNGGTLNYFVNTGDRISAAGALTGGRWHHIAVARRGTSTKMFCNGVQVGSTYSDSNSYLAPTVRLANTFDGYTANVYLDDVRVTNGLARYVDSFSPPTAAFDSELSSDPHLSNVSLLLKMDGANNSTTFTDSSLTPKAVFANGDAKISTAQSKFGGASGVFDGTGDYIKTPSNAAFAFETGDFTVETWVRFTSLGSYQSVVTTRTGAVSVTTAWSLGATSTGAVYLYTNGFVAASATGLVTTGTWYHLAVARSGTTARLFLDGTLVATGSNSQSFTDQVLAVGANGDGSEAVNGYIDDLRITKGVARYTANFLPPTIAHPVWSETDASFSSVSLLLNGNGANASTVIADRSSNGLTLVPNGNAQISTTQNRFGGSSLYFDGTGDFLSVAASSALVFDADFTIEGWIFCSSVTSNKGIFASSGERFGLIRISNYLYWLGSTDISGSSITFAANTWIHVAACRSGTTLRLFANGQLAGSGTSTQTPASNTWYVGSNQSNEQFDGYIDDLRITKGVARYTTAFTPPVAPLPIPVIDLNFGAVSLLLHMNGANASTTFPDHSYNALAVTANGNAQISTAQSKFGGASALFDGTGDRLTLASSPLFGFGTGDFTCECWIHRTVSVNQNILDFRTAADVQTWVWNITSNAISMYTPSGTLISGTTVLAANQWYHVAITRSGGTIRQFVNGVLEGSGTNTSDFQSSRPLTIGGTPDAVNGMFTGYIDDIRITKGIARYTANFTPPTAQFPNS